jgi:predicted ATP-dependent serine protease
MKIVDLMTCEVIQMEKLKNKTGNSLADFVKFKSKGIVSICGRPSSGKTTILLDVLLERTLQNNENSLLLYSDNQTVSKLISKSEFSALENNIVFTSQYEKPQDIKAIIESCRQKFDSIYIDDLDTFNLGFLDSTIELEEEAYSSTILSENTKKTLSYLKELSKHINVILVGHISRRPDIRGGDHMPRISDIENPLLEKISSKILLLYRPENYGFTCDEQGGDIDNTIIISIPKNNEGNVNIEFNQEIKGYNKI